MSRSGADRRRAAGAALLALLSTLGWLAAVPPAAAEVVSSPGATGVELTTPVRQNLRQLQEQWLQWIRAGDAERAERAVDDLLATARQLGMTRLPDLSLAALVQAARAGDKGDFRRARWSLDAAERLDPRRPETAFAAARVDRREGRPLAALGELASGYQRLLFFPMERYLWAQDAVLWGLCLLLFTGGFFVAVQMATKGGALLRDVLRALEARLPGRAALVVAVVALAWPLLLPWGLLWLLLYWSLLLWGYGSRSERSVLIGLWLLLGVSPFLISAQRRHLAVALSPPGRAMESLAQGRLYGGLFTDLGVLRSLLPDSPAVKHLLADVHRSLNQWDLARSLYRQVLEKEPDNTSALLNLGAYYFYKRDFANAIQLFQRAAASDPGSAAAQFDLSQAFNDSYLFDEARRALSQAQAIDAARVDEWTRKVDQQRVITIQGGMARIPEIRRQLLASAGSREGTATPRLDLFRRALSLALAAVMALLAVALHLARRGKGYTEPPLDLRLGGGTLDRWRRALLPGVAAAEAGEGGKTFLALLVPAALLTLPLAGDLGYRIPWGYDPGSLVPWIAALLGIAAYLAVRVQRELRDRI
jgi:tetratricopeptide (TPR) repeat protein